MRPQESISETTYIPGCTQKARWQRSFSSYHPWSLYYASCLVLKLNSLGFSFVHKFRKITRQDRDKCFWEASSSSFKIGPESWVCCEGDRRATIAQGMSKQCPAFEVVPPFTGEISPRKHCNHWFYIGTLLTSVSSTVIVLNRNGTTGPLGDLGCLYQGHLGGRCLVKGISKESSTYWMTHTPSRLVWCDIFVPRTAMKDYSVRFYLSSSLESEGQKTGKAE